MHSCSHTCGDANPFTSNNPTRWNHVPLSVLASLVTEPSPVSLPHISFSRKTPLLESPLDPGSCQNLECGSLVAPRSILAEAHSPAREPPPHGPPASGLTVSWTPTGRSRVLELFRASDRGKRRERSPRALRLGAELRSGGSPRSPGSRVPSLPVARPAGPPGLPCRGWISPGLSELHRHQGEAALGYHRPGEHRRQNKHWSRSSTGSLLAAGNNYKVIGPVFKSPPEGRLWAQGEATS